MRLILTEKQENILKKLLLTEADDRIKKVNKIIDAEFGNTALSSILDNTVSGDEYYVGGNPQTTWRQYLLFSLRHTFGLMTNADVKYLPLVAKLAFSDEVGFEKRDGNGTQVRILQNIVMLLKKDDALFQQIKTNQNITFSQLYNQLKPQLDAIANADSEAANNVSIRSDYDIIEVPDFKTANYYGNYSCSESKLCYTQSEHTWENYTQKGANRVYVCLKHGWEDIPEEFGPNNPYDEYGTSMIFVFIDPEGDIAYSNCRWNHHSNADYNVDHAFTKASLAETVGVRFNDVFNPYSKEVLRKKGIISLSDVQDILNQSDFNNFSEVFNDYVVLSDEHDANYLGYDVYAVNLREKWNIVASTHNELRLVSSEWFDYVYDFNEGIARVLLNHKRNHIDMNGNILSSTWFDNVGPFSDGYASVQLNGKGWNFINKNGQILSNEWFDCVYNFIDGYAIVDKTFNGVWLENIIDRNGNIISKEWYDDCSKVTNGYARVERNNMMNFIDVNGNLISNNWFDYVASFTKNGVAKVTNATEGGGEISNIINTKGNLLFDTWFDSIRYVKDGNENIRLFRVRLDGRFSFISIDGKFLTNQWFDVVDYFSWNANNGIGYCVVGIYGKGYAVINCNGEIVSEWYNTKATAIEARRHLIMVKESKSVKKLVITEEQENALRDLLTEADDRIKKVNKIIEKAFGGILNLDGPVRGPEYYVNNNPETTWRTYLLFNLRHTLGLMTNADVKYLPLAASLAYSDEVGFDLRDDNGTEKQILYNIIQLLKQDDALFQQVKANPNISFNELYKQLKPQLDSMADADSEAANNVEERNDYEIIWVKDFQTANYYGNKSCSESKLCYTQGQGTWQGYTRNGWNKVYVCLKHGWEDIPEKPGEGNPYDEYGTSMIFVFIEPEGNISNSNCRWNHKVEEGCHYNGDVDHAFTKTTLAETVGVKFDSVFKPYSEEELLAKGFIPFDKVQGMLDSGKKASEIFIIGDNIDNIYIVQLNDKYNVLDIDSYKLLYDKWFDFAGNFYDGFARVVLNNQYNFINSNGQLISDVWFSWVSDGFTDGFGIVRNDRKFNFIDANGNILSELWFDSVKYFQGGLAKVINNNKYNFINTSGKLLSPNQWFDRVGNFNEDGIASVYLNDKTNFITKSGKIVSYKWFTGMLRYNNDWYSIVDNNKYYNFLNINTLKLYSVCWFDDLKFTGNGTIYGLANGRWVEIKLNSKGIHEGKKKKKPAAQDHVGGKVNAGVMDAVVYGGGMCENVEGDEYKLGAEKGMSPYYHVNESNEEIITLYHGVNRKGLEFNLENGGFIPRVCSEGGPKAVWLSEKQYNYEFTFAFDFPKSLVEQLSNVDYIFTNKIGFNDFNCRLVKTSISSYLDDIVVETNILNDKLSKLHFRYFPDLGIILWKEFKQYPNVLEKYINPYIEKYQKLQESIIKESPDSIWSLGLNFRDREAVTFMYYLKTNKFYVANRQTTHVQMMKELGLSDEECKEIDGDNFFKYVDLERTGRYWPSANVISFWQTPVYNKNKMMDAITSFSVRSNIDIKYLLVDYWDGAVDRLIPFRWFTNGTFDMLKEKGFFQIYPNDSSEYIDSKKYTTFTVFFQNGEKYELDIAGNFVENKYQYAYAFNESKKVVKNDKGEIVPETCDKCGGKVVTQIHGEPVYVCKDCGKYFGTVPFTLKENIESEIVNPDDVDLSSFNIKKNLNPKFWKNGVLDSRIRMKLLDIADDFIEFLGIDWAKPEDITMTGSLANFNWDENYSDIDLHIIMDYSDVDERTEFVSNYFYSQKKLWNEEHSDITIMGYPVEVFVQDVNERHDSSGVYSLEKNKWLIEPEREKLASSKVNKSFIKDKVSEYMNKIDKIEYLFNKSKDDEYRLRRILEKSEKLFDKIKGDRKLGFEKSGGKEINNYNIVFKALRRNGYIEKLVNIKSTTYDKLNSINENKKIGYAVK